MGSGSRGGQMDGWIGWLGGPANEWGGGRDDHRREWMN